MHHQEFRKGAFDCKALDVISINPAKSRGNGRQPLLFAKLALEAGFPPGLIQVLSGPGHTVGAALAKHMRIRKVIPHRNSIPYRMANDASVDFLYRINQNRPLDLGYGSRIKFKKCHPRAVSPPVSNKQHLTANRASGAAILQL